MNLQWGRAFVVVALTWLGAVQAAEMVPTPQAGLEQVQAQKRAAYEAVLARFDRAIEATPDDASIGVARCEYINQFTDSESGDWVAGAEEAFDACGAWLHERWPSAPAVQLFELEMTWDADGIALGEKLGKAIDAWPAPLRTRALSHMAWVYEEHDAEKSGKYAVRAAELGSVDVVDTAIDHLVAHKRYDEATRLLDRATVPTNDWTATRIVRAALALPDKQAAWRTVQRFERGDMAEIQTVVAATAQLRAGDAAGARKRLGDEQVPGDDSQLAFEIAVAARDADTALAYIDMSDMDDINTSMGRFAVLASAMPSTLATIPMFSLAFGVLVMLALTALGAGMVLVPVHYRGLVRRLRHVRTEPLFARASLTKAWYGLAIALCVPVLAVFFVSPESVTPLFDGEKPPAMFIAMLWGTLLGLACLVPVLLGMSRRELVGDRATWRAWKRIPLAFVALVAVGFVQANFLEWTGAGGETLHTEIIDAVMGEGQAAFGGFGAMLLIACLAPLFEELVFRGLLLGGLTRHISFRWANVLQALAFAFVHDDMPRFAFYFALGLLAGWLVKSTRSLGPAVVLHVINNAIVVGLMTMLV